MLQKKWTEVDVDEHPEVLELIFPNPTNNIVNINFNVAIPSNFSIEIDDLSGIKIADIFQGLLENSIKSIPYDCSQLSNGIYLIKISSPNFVKTFKLVKEG